MASVTITLPSSAYFTTQTVKVRYGLPVHSRLSLGISLSVDGNTEIYLQGITLASGPISDPVEIRLTRSQTEPESEPGVSGPDFSTQMENFGTIRYVASDGTTLVLIGISDSTEVYKWTPSNIGEVYVFANHIFSLADRSLVVTFNDNTSNTYRRNVSGDYELVDSYRVNLSGDYELVDDYERDAMGDYVQV